jgi:hypothetical protein
MEIIADADTLATLDTAVCRFIDSAWEPPSTELATAGLRRRKPDFPDKREVMTAAAAAMDRTFRDRSTEEIVYDPHPSRDAFDRWMAQEDATLRAYRMLMEAWNQRRDLGVCRACDNLLLPGKGRVARYCSDACRMRMYRSVADAIPPYDARQMEQVRAWDEADREELEELEEPEVVIRNATDRRRRRSSSKGES